MSAIFYYVYIYTVTLSLYTPFCSVCKICVISKHNDNSTYRSAVPSETSWISSNASGQFASARWQVVVESNCSEYSKRSVSSAAPAPLGVATDTRWKFTFPAGQTRSNNLFNSISLPSYVLGMKMSKQRDEWPACVHAAMWACGMWHQCKKFVPIRGRLVRTVGRLVSPRRRCAFASSCVNQMFCFSLPPAQQFCSLFLFFSPLWRSSFYALCLSLSLSPFFSPRSLERVYINIQRISMYIYILYICIYLMNF